MYSLQHSHFLFFIILFFSSVHLVSSYSKVPAIIIFGDSTVDTGNNNFIATPVKSNFEPYGRDFIGGKPTGRFCNGRLVPDFLSEALGLGTLVPAYLDPDYGIEDFAKGVSFASAGTGLDIATSNVLNVIPLNKEIEYFREFQSRLRSYVGKAQAGFIIDQAIYITSIGTNDFVENYYLFITGRYKQFSPDEYQDYLISLARDFLIEIYRLGARKISFAGLGPMGCLPFERTFNALNERSCIEEYSEAARNFNMKLERLIGGLNRELHGIKLRYSSVYDMAADIIQRPSNYGIENVRDGCCGTGEFETIYLCNKWSPCTCPDADKYMFWDSFHPTEKINRIVAMSMLYNGSLVDLI